MLGRGGGMQAEQFSWSAMSECRETGKNAVGTYKFLNLVKVFAVERHACFKYCHLEWIPFF